MSRSKRAIVYGILGGVLLAGGWIVIGLLIANMTQDTVESFAPGTTPPATSEILAPDTVWAIAPWLFLIGFVAVAGANLRRSRY